MEKEKKSFSSIFHNAYTAWVILILSLAVTVVAWYISTKFSNQLAEDRFTSRATEIATAVDDRMMLYEQALWGGVALFNASDEVTRKDWQNYVMTLDIQNKLPGIQGMGYAVPIDENGKDSLTHLLRTEGFSDFEVKPEGVRESYSSIIYLEPFDWRNQRAFGFDMWSNEMRREAMQRAIDENAAATSGIITLVQETEKDIQKGFLTYLPVRDKDADSTFKGWVYAAFRAGDLMNGILGNSGGYDIELYDDGMKSEENLLYSSDSIVSGLRGSFSAQFTKEIILNIQGRNWLLYVRSNESFLETKDAIIPRIIAIGGLIIDLLLFFVILSISRSQSKAEALVEKRTAELNLERKALQKMNDELSQFAYITSHDLQEPLRTIISFISLLESKSSDQLDEKSQKFMGIIVSSADRLSELIVAILNFSRIGMSSQIQSINANEVIQFALGDLNSLIERNNAQINVQKLPTLNGHKPEFQMLIQNLITNAIKFRKPDLDPVVTISFTEDATHYIFSIEDNGIGIEEQYQERIFKIFQRLHSRTEYEGTGIGLAHCRKVAELHKGEVWVESTLGKGSTFYFSILKV